MKPRDPASHAAYAAGIASVSEPNQSTSRIDLRMSNVKQIVSGCEGMPKRIAEYRATCNPWWIRATIH